MLFSLISRKNVHNVRKQVIFDDEVGFIQHQHAQLDLYSVSSLKQVSGQTCRSTRTHYPDSKTTSLWSYSLMMCAQRRSSNINLIYFGLTRPEIEPMIYRTQGEHANEINHICSGAPKFIPLVISGVVQYFVNHCLYFCPFSFDHCIVSPSIQSF